MPVMIGSVPPEAVGLKLYRMAGERLIGCEGVRFAEGAAAVGCVLRRAAISGKVVIGGQLENHFADVLDANGSMVENVALDARSYRALKSRWMRWRVEG